MMVVSQTLLWIVVLVLSAVVLALARQVGILYERIAPAGALAIGKGPQPGDAAPRISSRTLSGRTIEIGGARPGRGLQLLMFVAPSCPICKQLLPTASHFASSERLDLIVVGDGELEPHRRMAVEYRLNEDRFANGPEIGRAFHVGKLPYAVLLDPDGTIISAGLVNTREHLESLVGVHETGHKSVQDYLRSTRATEPKSGELEKHVG